MFRRAMPKANKPQSRSASSSEAASARPVRPSDYKVKKRMRRPAAPSDPELTLEGDGIEMGPVIFSLLSQDEHSGESRQ